MKSKVFKIEPNGQCGFEFVEGTEKTPIGLKALQKAVGGFVQCINLHYMGLPDIDLWLNEEGKIHGLALNPIATLLSRLYKYGDVIVGPVLICSSNDEGEAVGLNEEQEEKLLAHLKKVLEAIEK